MPIPRAKPDGATRLTSYYQELGLDPAAPVTAANRAPFDEAMCAVVEELKPEVVSFHFGLPRAGAGRSASRRRAAIVMSSATTVKEAIWLEENGADVIIAQGAEAGGHRGMFLTDDIAAAARHLRAGAAGGRCGEGAGDRRGRHRRRARHRGGVRARRSRRADRQRLSALSGIQGDCAARAPRWPRRMTIPPSSPMS